MGKRCTAMGKRCTAMGKRCTAIRVLQCREVVKHSAAIQIQNNITLLQRRAWNVLLANAYDELPTQETHQVKVAELMEKLEFSSKNDEYLKGALKALVGCKVEWN